MVILCDTCSVLMLIRVSPEMFSNPKYEVTTLPGVAQEFIRIQKFKTKYPWRSSYSEHIKAEPASKLNSPEYGMVLSIINNLLESGVINSKNDRLFDLSFVDKQVVSYSIAHSCAISTGDQGIIDFATQEFPDEFPGNIHPLDLINRWLKNGLFVWDEAKHRILVEWAVTGERPQSETAKFEFKEITGKEYPGP
jgi:hypothetical protein